MFRSLPCSAIVTAVVVFGTELKAAPITAAAFSSGAGFESFEGIVPGANVGVNGTFPNLMYPGISSTFTFASGVSLTTPIPNPGSISLNLVDFSRPMPHVGFALGGNGTVSTAADVPFGSAFLGMNGFGSNTGPIELALPYIVDRVGAYVTAPPLLLPSFTGIITLEVFDASNTLLESLSISAVTVANWPANFLGVQNSGGISKVRFSGDFILVDGLTFEAVSAVPEPSSMVLLLIGTTGVCCFRLRRNRRQYSARQTAA